MLVNVSKMFPALGSWTNFKKRITCTSHRVWELFYYTLINIAYIQVCK